MKLAKLKAVGHNIADSLSSGIGLMIGYYQMNVYAEAGSENDGYVIVNFLAGTTTGERVSESFKEAVRLYRDALDTLCDKHKVQARDFTKLEVRYGTDQVYGPHFTVGVQDRNGRESIDLYSGTSGRRLQRRRRGGSTFK